MLMPFLVLVKLDSVPFVVVFIIMHYELLAAVSSELLFRIYIDYNYNYTILILSV
jgi:hypothetical protein